jgi:hypothetical protein
MQNKLISRLSLFLMVCFAGFVVVYLYRFLVGMIPFSFTAPELWNTHWMMDKGMQIPMYWRVGFFAMWMFTVISTALMGLCAIWVVNLIRMGVYFERRTILGLGLLGVFGVLSGVGKIIGASFEPWFLTRFNSVETQRDIYFWYSSADIGVSLIGVSVVLLAWVLRVAVLTDVENKEFV